MVYGNDTAMVWEFVLRLLVAGILGGAIGLEREYRAKVAGLRTHFLVALGSCLLMIVSQHGFGDIAAQMGGEFKFDPSRIAAQIVSGIGFIGAGTIIFQKQMVRGLTTAAGLWTAAGIGMAVGSGMYILGTAATILTLGGLEILRWLLHHIGMNARDERLVFVVKDQEALEAALAGLRELGIDIVSSSSKEGKSGFTVRMVIRVHGDSSEEEHIISLLKTISGAKFEKLT